MPRPSSRSRIARAAALVLVSLLATGCPRIVEHVELPSMGVDDPAFTATLAGYAGTAAIGGNRVDVLLNGDEIFPAKLAAIRSARRSITYAQYVFEGSDGPAEATAAALAERCRAGIKVNVLLDAVGSLAMDPAHRQHMKDAGCQVVDFRPLTPFTIDRSNHRNHRRILVVDGQLAITGGAGTSDAWSGDGLHEGHWRDTDVRVVGPVVAQLQGAFAANWLEATGTALGGPDYFPRPIEPRGTVTAQAVRSSTTEGSTTMYTTLLLAMAAARRSIYITNPYFLPEDEMTETLRRAARRGVRVVLLIPAALDHVLVRRASRSELGPLLEAGVEVHEYTAAMLHAKTMVIDGRWATVGSANLDPRSLGLNEELNLLVYDAGVARRLEAVFRDDLTRSRRITYERWNNRGPLARILELLSRPFRSQL